MSRAPVILRCCVVLACGLALVPFADAARKREKTIKDLPARPVVINPDQKVEASADRAMQSYRRFLELQKTDPKLRAEALRRLGDLNLEVGEVERMASEVSAIDLQGAEAIKLYTTLLKAYPDYPRNDQVLYQLARAYETTGQTDKALGTLDQLVKRFPRSPQLDEVQFRRGELLFSAKNYAAAQDAYYVVVQRPQSSFFEQSLYKHGWSLFKQGLSEECLVSFAGVLESTMVSPTDKTRLRTLEEMSRPERELAEDTLRVMSITFSYLDGVDTLNDFLGKRGNPAYSSVLYSRLGDLYVEKERYQDAAKTFRAFVARNPNSEFAPGLSNQAIDAYRKGGFPQLVLESKREYVELYNYDSAFWQGRDRAQYPSIGADLKTNLKDVAEYLHANAQKSRKPDDFREAARWYRSYLVSFPNEPETAATNFALAEALFDGQDYAAAAEEFERTAYNYPKSDKSAKAAYAALSAYLKERERAAPEAKAEWQKRSIDAGIKFAEAFPEHPDSSGVLTRAAQDVFAQNDLPRAVDLSKRVLALQPPPDTTKQRVVWTIIGQASFDQGQFAEAERGYIAARDLLPANDKMRADLTERIATAVYKQAEAKQKTGDTAGAVDDFMRVASVAPDSKIRATAEYDAAAQLINQKDWNRAITVLTNYRARYPRSEFARDVTRKLAVAYGEAGRPAEAAAEFERIALNPNEELGVQREALLQSADLYGKAGRTRKAVGMLERFVEMYPRPVADALEAKFKLAEYSGKAGEIDNQREYYRQIIRADRSAGAGRTDRTQYLAAKSQLALTEPARDEFRSIRLALPLKQSLTRKRKAMDAALNGYKLAADYRVAEVTTAATFEIAELYRQLGVDIMRSERPKGLDAAEVEEYGSLLEEQAFPFEEQAIKTHEVNSARVADGVYDEWVQKSFAALAKLKPGRYGKTELVQEVVDSAN